MYIRKELEAH